MVKIRLKQLGKKHQKVYRIIVTDEKNWRDGKAIATVGFYNPATEPSQIEMNKVKVDEWIKKGAQMSDQVKILYSKI